MPCLKQRVPLPLCLLVRLVALGKKAKRTSVSTLPPKTDPNRWKTTGAREADRLHLHANLTHLRLMRRPTLCLFSFFITLLSSFCFSLQLLSFFFFLRPLLAHSYYAVHEGERCAGNALSSFGGPVASSFSSASRLRMLRPSCPVLLKFIAAAGHSVLLCGCRLVCGFVCIKIPTFLCFPKFFRGGRGGTGGTGLVLVAYKALPVQRQIVFIILFRTAFTSLKTSIPGRRIISA